MLFVVLNILIIAFVSAFLFERLGLEKYMPERPIFRGIIKFIGAILAWVLAAYLATLLPEKWIKSVPDTSTEQGVCYDKQGAYEC